MLQNMPVKEDLDKAVMLVIERGHTISSAHRLTGVSKFRIRRALNYHGAEKVDMRRYGQQSEERKMRRRMVLDAVLETGSFSKAGKKLNISRQRVYQIWLKYGQKPETPEDF